MLVADTLLRREPISKKKKNEISPYSPRRSDECKLSPVYVFHEAVVSRVFKKNRKKKTAPRASLRDLLLDPRNASAMTQI